MLLILITKSVVKRLTHHEQWKQSFATSLSVMCIFYIDDCFLHPADVCPIRDILSLFLRHSMLSLAFGKHVSSLT